MSDVSRLRDLARKGEREPLNDAEIAELPVLRQRLRRANADDAVALIIQTRLRGGWNFF